MFLLIFRALYQLLNLWCHKRRIDFVFDISITILKRLTEARLWKTGYGMLQELQLLIGLKVKWMSCERLMKRHSIGWQTDHLCIGLGHILVQLQNVTFSWITCVKVSMHISLKEGIKPSSQRWRPLDVYWWGECKWKGNSSKKIEGPICPKIQKRVEKMKVESGNCIPTWVGDGKFQIMCPYGDQ